MGAAAGGLAAAAGTIVRGLQLVRSHPPACVAALGRRVRLLVRRPGCGRALLAAGRCNHATPSQLHRAMQ